MNWKKNCAAVAARVKMTQWVNEGYEMEYLANEMAKKSLAA